MPIGDQTADGGESEDGKPEREPITTLDFFEEELSELRSRLGWTQPELGRFFGVTKLTAHRWEKQGVGETEPRKAALRIVEGALERSSAPAGLVGDVLLNAGVVKTMTAATQEGPGFREGALDEPMNWRIVFGLRDRLGWTQTEFALFLGITHSVPAVWESGEGTFDDAIRAALLALYLSSDPDRPRYPEPETPWDELKTKGLQAFCNEVMELKVDLEGHPRFAR
jgi:DNA-binding transcriptional regulator YiaG